MKIPFIQKLDGDHSLIWHIKMTICLADKGLREYLTTDINFGRTKISPENRESFRKEHAKIVMRLEDC
jgi:hypothetical protein